MFVGSVNSYLDWGRISTAGNLLFRPRGATEWVEPTESLRSKGGVSKVSS